LLSVPILVSTCSRSMSSSLQDELGFLGMIEMPSTNGHGWRSANRLQTVELDTILVGNTCRLQATGR
jgi:hypothetical protein